MQIIVRLDYHAQIRAGRTPAQRAVVNLELDVEPGHPLHLTEPLREMLANRTTLDDDEGVFYLRDRAQSDITLPDGTAEALVDYLKAEVEDARQKCVSRGLANLGALIQDAAAAELVTDEDVRGDGSIEVPGTADRWRCSNLYAIQAPNWAPIKGRIAAILAEREAEKARKLVAEREANALAAAKHEAEAKALEAERLDLAEKYCSHEQIERARAGVLPEAELIDALRTVFLPDPPIEFCLEPYRPLLNQDVPHDEYCPGEARPRRTSEDYEGPLTADQFRALKAARAAHPKAEVQVRRNELECLAHGCTEPVSKLSVRCVVTVAGIKVVRTYACD